MGAIIWLASFPKSGNTWLRAFLHNLLRNPQEGYDINKLDDFTLGESAYGWYRMFDDRPLEAYTVAEVAALRPKVHRHLTTLFPDSVFAKTHCAVMEDHGVPTITFEVTAGAIYVVRNPLDVAVSYAHHLGASLDDTIAYMAKPRAMTPASNNHVQELLGSWSEHVESWTTKPNRALHVVRYEDMLMKPQTAFGGIVRFLGLKPPRERLERAIARSSFRVLQEQERRHGFKEKSAQAERFFREGKAGQWRKALTPEQVERVVSAHRQQMQRFGYYPLG
ncbi:MAG TPA: sulfotransferase domain-containing protein [Alphaproteobacteria bacterium]|nr:sulfotransferase domain-containing protein [Alphaproteobacteria bacterium]